MMPFVMPLASVVADADASGVTWPKSHIAPYFNGPGLMSSVVPFMMLLVSHDTYAKGVMVALTVLLASHDASVIAIGIMGPKKSCCTSF